MEASLTERAYPCSQCPYLTSLATRLKWHMEKHEPSKTQPLSSQPSLPEKKPLNKTGQKETALGATVPQDRYHSKPSRQVSFKTWLKCSDCHFRTHWQSKLAVHRNLNICNPQSDMNSSGNFHDSTRAGAPPDPYKCMLCPYKSVIYGSIIQHLLVRHHIEKNLTKFIEGTQSSINTDYQHGLGKHTPALLIQDVFSSSVFSHQAVASAVTLPYPSVDTSVTSSDSDSDEEHSESDKYQNKTLESLDGFIKGKVSTNVKQEKQTPTKTGQVSPSPPTSSNAADLNIGPIPIDIVYDLIGERETRKRKRVNYFEDEDEPEVFEHEDYRPEGSTMSSDSDDLSYTAPSKNSRSTAAMPRSSERNLPMAKIKPVGPVGSNSDQHSAQVVSLEPHRPVTLPLKNSSVVANSEESQLLTSDTLVNQCPHPVYRHRSGLQEFILPTYLIDSNSLTNQKVGCYYKGIGKVFDDLVVSIEKNPPSDVDHAQFQVVWYVSKPLTTISDAKQILHSLCNKAMIAAPVNLSTVHTVTQKTKMASTVIDDVPDGQSAPKDLQESKKCAKCHQTFEATALFNRHIRDAHFQCDRCLKIFRDKAFLAMHLVNTHKLGVPSLLVDFKIRCNICEKVMEVIEGLTHADTAHPDQTTFIAHSIKTKAPEMTIFVHMPTPMTDAAAVFREKYLPTTKPRVAMVPNIRTSLQAEAFGSQDTIAGPAQITPPQATPGASITGPNSRSQAGTGELICSICFANFPHRLLKDHHVWAVHPVCKICEMRFKNRQARSDHVTSVHKRSICMACDKDASTAERIRRHVMKTHIDPSSGCFTCVECGTKGINPKDILSHLQRDDWNRLKVCHVCKKTIEGHLLPHLEKHEKAKRR